MANKKMRKVIAMLSVLAMLATFVPVVVFAGNTVELTADFANTEKTAIKVEGSLSGDGDITLLVIRSDASLNGTIPAELTESNIMFVDQQDKDKANESWESIPLRDTSATGNYITVFMGGSNVEAFQSKELKLQSAAVSVTVPMVALEEGKDYYVDGNQVLDFTGVHQEWLDAVTVTVFDGEDEAGSVSTLTGNITLNNAPDEVKDYTIKFSSVEGYVDVADKSVKVISADGEMLMNYEGGTPAWVDNDQASDSWTISIPASTEDVTISVTNEGEDVTATVEEGVLTVARADVGGDSQTIVVTATAGSASKTLGTFVVPAKGAAAPAVEAANVTVAIRDNVYGKTGYKLIKVVAANVNHESQSITVGTQKLYYSVDKDAYYGIVNVEDVGAEAVTPETVAAAANPTNEASDIFYFGKANNPSNPRNAQTGKVTAQDVAAAKKIVLKVKTFTPDVDVYMAADVNSAEPDGQVTAQDVAALKKNVLNAIVFPVIK